MILPLWLVVSTRQMFKGHLPQFGENFNMLEKPASNYTHTGSCQNNVTVDHDRPPHTHFTNHYHPSTWLKPPASYSIYYTHKYLHESMTKHYQPSKWKTIYLANMFFFQPLSSYLPLWVPPSEPLPRHWSWCCPPHRWRHVFVRRPNLKEQPGGWLSPISPKFLKTFLGRKKQLVGGCTNPSEKD